MGNFNTARPLVPYAVKYGATKHIRIGNQLVTSKQKDNKRGRDTMYSYINTDTKKAVARFSRPFRDNHACYFGCHAVNLSAKSFARFNSASIIAPSDGTANTRLTSSAVLHSVSA